MISKVALGVKRLGGACRGWVGVDVTWTPRLLTGGFLIQPPPPPPPSPSQPPAGGQNVYGVSTSSATLGHPPCAQVWFSARNASNCSNMAPSTSTFYSCLSGHYCRPTNTACHIHLLPTGDAQADCHRPHPPFTYFGPCCFPLATPPGLRCHERVS